MADQHFFSHDFFGRETQLSRKEQLYLENNATDGVMKLVRLAPKTLGTLCKNIMSHSLTLAPKRGTGDFDGFFRLRSGTMARVKIKSACYWSSGLWKWQHIKHIDDGSHDVLILIGIGFKATTVAEFPKNLEEIPYK